MTFRSERSQISTGRLFFLALSSTYQPYVLRFLHFFHKGFCTSKPGSRQKSPREFNRFNFLQPDRWLLPRNADATQKEIRKIPSSRIKKTFQFAKENAGVISARSIESLRTAHRSHKIKSSNRSTKQPSHLLQPLLLIGASNNNQ